MAIVGQRVKRWLLTTIGFQSTDFRFTRKVPSDFTDHKANFIHMACDHDASGYQPLLSGVITSQAVCDHFIHMWSDLFA